MRFFPHSTTTTRAPPHPKHTLPNTSVPWADRTISPFSFITKFGRPLQRKQKNQRNEKSQPAMRSKTISLFSIISTITFAVLSQAAWNPSAKNNVVVYWGQNAASSITKQPAAQQKGLLHYCQDPNVDVRPATNLSQSFHHTLLTLTHSLRLAHRNRLCI